MHLAEPALGPVLANIFVGYCEDQMEEDKWLLFYNRFVDDRFTIFTNEQHSTEFFADIIVARGRSQAHLDVLEALYIQSLSPTLCCQKDFVRVLSLF